MSSFLKIILKDYWRVAAFYPTPKKVVKKILSKVPKGTKYFLEYGPGNGAFTQEILKRLPKDGKLFAFETNQDFIEELKKIKDSRLVLFPKDVREMPADLPKVNVIISGIPFSRINKKDREKIIKRSSELMTSDGIFVTYQVVPIVIFILKKYFKKINWYFEPHIFLPYFIILARK